MVWSDKSEVVTWRGFTKNEEVVEGSFLERDSSTDVFLQILRKCLGQFFQKTSVRVASEDLPY